jgi:hypothetical protein
MREQVAELERQAAALLLRRRPGKHVRAGPLVPETGRATNAIPCRDPPGHACYAGDLPGHFDQPFGCLPVEMKASICPRPTPCLIRSRGPSGEQVVRLGMPLVDDLNGVS